MKRKNNLYPEIYKMEHINKAFNEVCRNTKNKIKVRNYREFKCIYISRIYNILKNKTYEVGPYNVFTIHEPKKRRIVSQQLTDKVINHLVSRYILHPSILPCLIPENVASIENRGTKEGLRLCYRYHQLCKTKYKNYYILKCDISKFFGSINQNILKEKLIKKIKDKDALSIVFKIIDSDKDGLSIGNMTSQVLAVFYLNDLDHYIKEILKIKYYVRYQDDFLLFHPSKDYLKYCLDKIKVFLQKEDLTLNPKSRILKNTNNFIFLGRNQKGKYAKYREIRRKIKYKSFLYRTGYISLNNFVSSLICYEHLKKKSSYL